MVDTVLDPIRMPVVSLSQAEMDEIHDLIAKGQLSSDFLDRHHAAVRANVFGHDHKTDRDGNPIEQGLGSAINQTRNSINAYRRYAKYEPDYTVEGFNAAIKRMEAELKVANEIKAARAKAEPRRRAT
jgi:hypothetical protein